VDKFFQTLVRTSFTCQIRKQLRMDHLNFTRLWFV
jgi:hypothetical protein